MPSGLNQLLDKKELFALTWIGPVTPGVLLTGLGAGLGSSFWHDILDQLTKAKDKVSKLK
jgi:hypothetical protein